MQLLMYLQTVHFYRRVTYRQCTNIYNAIRRYNHVPHKEKNNLSSKRMSALFPEYTIIYSFPYINYPRIINVAKSSQTILLGAGIPIIIALQMLDFISEVSNTAMISCGCASLLWIHGFSYMCNNFIGTVYLKEDTNEVIISYVNYWGKRIDLKTNINNITLLTKVSKINDILYKELNVKECKQKLKINTTYGDIINPLGFKSIFGNL